MSHGFHTQINKSTYDPGTENQSPARCNNSINYIT